MAICKECNKEKGCGCHFSNVPNRNYAVCPDCKRKLLSEPKNNKDDNKVETNKPNVQGI